MRVGVFPGPGCGLDSMPTIPSASDGLRYYAAGAARQSTVWLTDACSEVQPSAFTAARDSRKQEAIEAHRHTGTPVTLRVILDPAFPKLACT